VTIRRWHKVLVAIFLLACLAEFSVRGPLRLLNGGMGWNDFLSPYIQARAWAHGQDPYSAQSLIACWPSINPRPPFVDRDVAAGTLEVKRGMPSPYPLTSLVMLSVFATLPWPIALSLWSAISVASVILAAFALLAICGCRLFDMRSKIFLGTVFALAPLHTGLATANPAMLVAGLIVGAIWAGHARREKTAGVLLALAICLKPTMAGGLLLYYLLRRRWIVVVMSFAVAATIAMVGWARLAVAGVPWIPSYIENSRRMFNVGSVDDFTQASGLRFNLINTQVFFAGLLNNAPVANLLAWLLGTTLLGRWIWLCYRRGSSSGLLEVSAVSILSLIPIYHRFYDAVLLMLPLAWSLLLVHKRLITVVTLATIVPFFVPGPIFLADLALSGRIPLTIAKGWWWNTIVLPHEVWDLILVAVLLLYFMWREPSARGSAPVQ
jgi:hypothetical protein